MPCSRRSRPRTSSSSASSPSSIGRLPIITPLMPLDATRRWSRILTEPKNALVKQYQHMFRLEDAKLSFTDAALHAIAEKAMKRKTGARALRAVMEEMMLNLLYELPEHSREGSSYVIDAQHVENSVALDELLVTRKESA